MERKGAYNLVTGLYTRTPGTKVGVGTATSMNSDRICVSATASLPESVTITI